MCGGVGVCVGVGGVGSVCGVRVWRARRVEGRSWCGSGSGAVEREQDGIIERLGKMTGAGWGGWGGAQVGASACGEPRASSAARPQSTRRSTSGRPHASHPTSPAPGYATPHPLASHHRHSSHSRPPLSPAILYTPLPPLLPLTCPHPPFPPRYPRATPLPPPLPTPTTMTHAHHAHHANRAIRSRHPNAPSTHPPPPPPHPPPPTPPPPPALVRTCTRTPRPPPPPRPTPHTPPHTLRPRTPLPPPPQTPTPHPSTPPSAPNRTDGKRINSGQTPGLPSPPPAHAQPRAPHRHPLHPLKLCQPCSLRRLNPLLPAKTLHTARQCAPQHASLVPRHTHACLTPPAPQAHQTVCSAHPSILRPLTRA